jgi:hypothetical protein
LRQARQGQRMNQRALPMLRGETLWKSYDPPSE